MTEIALQLSFKYMRIIMGYETIEIIIKEFIIRNILNYWLSEKLMPAIKARYL